MKSITIAILILATAMSPGALPAETTIPLPAGFGNRTYRKVLSWKELNEQNIVAQQHDYSCGSGALATLINIQFGETLTEADIITLLLRDKNESEFSEIEKNGYSLLELKKAAEEKGYTVSILKVGIDDLYRLAGPVIIYFEPDGEKHFAVLKQIQGNKAYLADPARGNIRVSLYRFREEWHGIIFALGKL